MLAHFIAIGLTALFFYHYGRTKQQYYLRMGLVFILLSVLVSIQMFVIKEHLANKIIGLEKESVAETEKLKQLNVTVREYLNLVKRSEWQDCVATPATDLAEYNLTIGGLDEDVIVATEPLIQLKREGEGRK